jgi:hypothetical protein
MEPLNKEQLNNPDNPLYIHALTRTDSKHIEAKLLSTKTKKLNCDLKLVGTVDDILQHLKAGPAKNLVNYFITYKTNKCDYCGTHKSKAIQLDRAHCNKDGCDRASLLRTAIEKYYIDERTPIVIKNILREFIRLHSGIPLFILCKTCHRIYDKK